MLRNSLNQNGLSHIKIVATDDYGSILPQDFVRDIFLDSWVGQCHWLSGVRQHMAHETASFAFSCQTLPLVTPNQIDCA